MATPECENISFACNGCGKAFSVPSSLAGRKAKCKACGQSVLIPAQPRKPETQPSDSVSPPARATPPILPPRAIGDVGPLLSGGPRSAASSRASQNKSQPTIEPRIHAPGGQSQGSASRLGIGKLARPPKATAAAKRRVTASIVFVLAVGVVVTALAYRQELTQQLGAVARSASRVVPAARALSPVRVIRQDEVDAVIRQASLNDISSKNVYQQMATFSQGAMKMSSLVALSYGAASSDIDGKLRAVDIAEIGTQTVHQQKAVYLEGMQNLLASAAKSSGVPSSRIEAVLSGVRIGDIGTKTVHQQCANYCSGCLQLAELLAGAEGASPERIRLVMSSVRTNDITADTVHQQNVAYLSGLAQMLALAATSRGAASSKTDAVLQEIRLADIGAKTVFQQEVNTLVGVMKLLGILAVGV